MGRCGQQWADSVPWRGGGDPTLGMVRATALSPLPPCARLNLNLPPTARPPRSRTSPSVHTGGWSHSRVRHTCTGFTTFLALQKRGKGGWACGYVGGQLYWAARNFLRAGGQPAAGQPAAGAGWHAKSRAQLQARARQPSPAPPHQNQGWPIRTASYEVNCRGGGNGGMDGWIRSLMHRSLAGTPCPHTARVVPKPCCAPCCAYGGSGLGPPSTSPPDQRPDPPSAHLAN